ncbi:signal peptide peptidase SppA [candidate division KSB1 bacterium]|nr:signal peptide peptidase SppA [candidate division KSB1 bacterium]
MKPIQVILYTLLTLFVLAIIFVSVVGLIIYAFSDTTPDVKSKSTLVISLSGVIPEYQAKADFPIGTKKGLCLKTILDDIEKAKKDKRIKGILLRINRNFLGWAKIDEIKNKLEDFKESGKYVFAYLGSFVSESEYFLSLAADSIFTAPGGFMEMNGLVIETVHLPGLLEKLGITLEYNAFGKYKSRSGEEMGRKKHSAPVLEMLNDVLDWEYNHLISGISQRLNITEKEVKNVINKSYLRPEKFAELGWIDDVIYEDQLYDKLKKLNGTKLTKKLNTISASTYGDITLESLGLNKGKKRIALIYSQGIIVEGDDQFSPLTMATSAGTDPMITAIRRAAKSKSVKAIVYRVNSPGGSGLGCDLVWREILKAKEKKPVIVSMSDYAASGGYWVSMGATAIVAQPSTLTGSIGIWGIFPNISGLYDKLGLVESNVKRGDHADMLLGVKKLSPYEKKLFRDNLYSGYVDFVTKAAQSRGKTFDELEPLAQGRTWMGEQAKQHGLIDELGGIERAIELAREKALIDSSESVKVVVYVTQKSWYEKLMSGGVLSWLFKNLNQKNLLENWQSILDNRRLLMWPMVPYQVRIH